MPPAPAAPDRGRPHIWPAGPAGIARRPRHSRAGFRGSTPSSRAVSGISCISPMAPLGDTASGWKPDSAFMTLRDEGFRERELLSPPAPPDRRGCGQRDRGRRLVAADGPEPARELAPAALLPARSRRPRWRAFPLRRRPRKSAPMPPLTSCRSACSRNPLPSTTIFARPKAGNGASPARPDKMKKTLHAQ